MSDKAKKRKTAYVIVWILLLIGSVLFSVFRFRPILGRTVQSIKDIGSSFKAYFYIFYGEPGAEPLSSVMQIPENIKSILPIEWNEFKNALALFRDQLFSWSNLKEFCSVLGQRIGEFCQYLIPLMPLVIVLVVLVRRKLKTVYKKGSVEGTANTSKALKAWEKLTRKIFRPIGKAIAGFWRFLKNEKWTNKILVLVWLYNLNILTIILEMFAYLTFFCAADFRAITMLWSQVVKLVADLTVAFDFLPGIVIFALFYYGFHRLRVKIGKKRVKNGIESTKELLKSIDGAIYITGIQGAGKTSTMTVLQLIQSEVFRNDMALPGMREIAAQFPFFPWYELEKFTRGNIRRGALPTKESIGYCFEILQQLNDRGGRMPKIRAKAYKRLLVKRYRYRYRNMMFDYDVSRFGRTYNNGIIDIDLFDAMKAYAQLYFVYDAPTSLIFATYPVREDFRRETLGDNTFPSYDFDYFKTASESKNATKMSHILNFNSLRLGKQKGGADPLAGGFEIGVAGMDENGKERGNQNTLAGIKATDDECNPKNDGFNDDDKMHRHIDEIYYMRFYRRFLTEQRATSISADNLDLMTVMHINEVKQKTAFPLYLEKDLLDLIERLHGKLASAIRRTGRDNTLFAYFAELLYKPFHKFKDSIKNRYGYDQQLMDITEGMNGSVIQSDYKFKKFYALSRSDRYNSTVIRKFYRRRVMAASGGLNDFPTYGSLEMTTKEMDQVRSFFYSRIMAEITSQLKTQNRR